MTRRTIEFSCAAAVIGLLAGVAGAATTVFLDFIEHLTYHYSFGSMLDGVSGSSRIRQACGPTIGGALAGFGWWLLRRRTSVPTVDQAISRPAPLPRGAMTLDAALQTLLVGSGASLGRENAPRQFAVALGDMATSRWALTARDGRSCWAARPAPGWARSTACPSAARCSLCGSCCAPGTFGLW